MIRLRTTVDQPLAGEVDLDAGLARIPEGHAIKGMLFHSLVATLGAPALAELEPALLAPPRLGRYLPFSDYPLRDYSRLSHAVAAKRYPRASLAQGVRLVARSDLETFRQSKMGSVVVALAPEFHDVYLKYPQLLPSVIRGPAASSERTGERAVRVVYREMYSPYYYLLGALEGIAAFFRQSLAADIEADDRGRITFDLSW